jgi:hypothetical protein
MLENVPALDVRLEIFAAVAETVEKFAVFPLMLLVVI